LNFLIAGSKSPEWTLLSSLGIKHTHPSSYTQMTFRD
jgi:hypothetical protein